MIHYFKSKTTKMKKSNY